MLLYCLLSFFQSGPQTVVAEAFRVEYVLLDVVALDKKGNLVDDLVLSDFEVTEDKQKIEATYFDTLDYRTDAPMPDMTEVPEEYRPAQSQEPPTRQVILALDMDELKMFDARRAFKQMRYFLESLDGSQRVKVNIYNMTTHSLSKGFLSDRDRLLAILDDFSDRYFQDYEDKRFGTSSRDSSLLLGNHDSSPNGWGIGRDAPRGPATLSERGNKFTDLEAAFKNCGMMGGVRCVQDRLDEYLEEQRTRTEQILAQLELLAYDFKEEKGLKIIFFLSPGFTMDNHYAALELAGKYGVHNDFLEVDQRFASQDQFKRVVHACIKNRVVFNTFDIFNGNLNHKYRSYVNETDRSLRSLANESGGSFSSKRQLKSSMNEALEKNSFFYVIGYNSPSRDSDAFRRIKLKVKRKGVTLHYRQGYYVNQEG